MDKRGVNNANVTNRSTMATGSFNALLIPSEQTTERPV